MEGPKGTRDPPPRPLARHLSDADRLRKVIQELMDTEKSYVKVTEGAVCSSLLTSPSPPAPGVAGCLLVGVPGSHVPRPQQSRRSCLLLEAVGRCPERWVRGRRAERTWEN